MPDEESLNKEKAVRHMVDESGLDLPQEYLDFLRNRKDYTVDVEAGVKLGAGLFKIYGVGDVIQINKDLEVEEFLSGFFVFGGDRANELLAFDTREPQPWKVYMVPMIVMSQEDAVEIADSFESFIKSEKASD
jgi:hypothetical protein